MDWTKIDFGQRPPSGLPMATKRMMTHRELGRKLTRLNIELVDLVMRSIHGKKNGS